MSRRFPSLYSAVALSLVLVLGSGCAPRLAVRPSIDESLSCKDAIVAPMLDTVVSATFAAPLTILAVQKLTSKDRSWESYETPAFVTLGTLAVAAGVAAFFGYRNANRCTKLKSQYTLCLNGDEPSCKALGVLANRKAERPNADNDAPLLQPSTPVAQ